jgi:outer membrane receptor for ferric coprogen and ferric-rhodotorulic acid
VVHGLYTEAADPATCGAGWRNVHCFQGAFGCTDARDQSFLYTAQTPRLQALLAGSYQVPTPAGDLLLRADYAWQDKIQFNVINDFNCQGGYGTVGGTHHWNPEC